MYYSIGHDLALMSLCNHTIVSHGTFSFWAGYLAGGYVIRPEHFQEYRYCVENLTFNFRIEKCFIALVDMVVIYFCVLVFSGNTVSILAYSGSIR